MHQTGFDKERDFLSEEAIRAHLPQTMRVGCRLDCLDEVDSTNTYLKRLAGQNVPDGLVAVANHQTAGRGRLGRGFQSPKGVGLYLSALLHPELSPEKLMPVTALCAVAIGAAVERVCGVRPQIKWTNDLLLRGKKIAGILTELVGGEAGRPQSLILGIGINVHQMPEDFSPDVRLMATSLRMELGRPVSRAALAAAEMQELDRLDQALRAGDTAAYLERYRADCITLGREVQILRADGSREHARALDIDEQFGLIVRMDDGETTVIRFGEASVRGMYGYAE